MNLQKISKAIAGGLAATAGGSGTAYMSLPAGLDVPAWIYVAVPIVNFAIGFVVVYFAPANKPA